MVAVLHGELDLPFRAVAVDLSKGKQAQPDFLRLNLENDFPAIVLSPMRMTDFWVRTSFHATLSVVCFRQLTRMQCRNLAGGFPPLARCWAARHTRPEAAVCSLPSASLSHRKPVILDAHYRR